MNFTATSGYQLNSKRQAELLRENFIIAIDGPAGSGKSTVAKRIAEILGILYLDSGAVYRAVTLLFLKENLDFSNQNEHISILLEKTDIRLENSVGGQRVFLNNGDVTAEIRSEKVTQQVSTIAENAAVRRWVTFFLRKLSKHTPVVMDGRDIGTAVFPSADLKFFLSASLEERALRRYRENRSADETADLNKIKMEIARRDRHDSNRAIAPLTKAEDAIEVDTTNMNIEQVVDAIVGHVTKLRSQA